ncbi:hypothetical protein ACH41H_42220 [Streptomyces sp. NPDC020800]|uniref:hypothetical protein n=1 Tax=Streptomyces sp. NPDC020800 TaxID=3365092 RepID=UPI0037A6F145
MSIKQRLSVVSLVAVIVVGLILAGASPELALTITSGIVLIAREVWTSGLQGARDRYAAASSQPTAPPSEPD